MAIQEPTEQQNTSAHPLDATNIVQRPILCMTRKPEEHTESSTEGCDNRKSKRRKIYADLLFSFGNPKIRFEAACIALKAADAAAEAATKAAAAVPKD